VLDDRVRPREEQPFVAVGPANKVGRASILPAHFDYLALARGFTDMMGTHLNVVTFGCLHRGLLLSRFPAAPIIGRPARDH
jgi:hypothetical protein